MLNLYRKLLYRSFHLIKTDDIRKDISEVVETRFDTSNYELDEPLPKERIKNWINWINER